MPQEPWDDWAEPDWAPWLDPATRAEDLAREVERTTAAFVSIASTLPEDLVRRPGSIGIWSAHDCIAHCLVWCEYAADVLRRTLNGTFRAEDFEYGDMDEFNERTAADRAGVPTQELLEGIDRSTTEVADMLRAITDQEWKASDRYRLVTVGAVTDHLDAHRSQFEALDRG